MHLKQRPPLLILGASARAAAESGLRAGRCIIAADLFGDHDTRQLSQFLGTADDLPGLVQLSHGISADVPCLLTGGFENHPELVTELANVRKCCNVSAETLAKARDPLNIQEILSGNGLPQTPTQAIHADPAHAEIHESKPLRWLKKPLRSAGGLNVGFATSGPRIEPGFYLQAFQPGIPLGAVFLSDHQHTQLIGITWQLSGTDSDGPGPFAYCGSIGPVVLSPASTRIVEAVGTTLAMELSLSGLFGVDGILGESGFHAVEINPRYPASLEVLELAGQCSWLAPHLNIFGDPVDPPVHPTTDEASPWTRPSGTIVGKLIVYAPQETIIRHPWKEVWTDAADEAMFVRRADLPRAGSRVPMAAPVCTVLASGLGIPQCLNRLTKSAERLGDTLDWPSKAMNIAIPKNLEWPSSLG